jgi:hypothetical protein
LKWNFGARQRHERGTQKARFPQALCKGRTNKTTPSFATPGDLNNFLIRRQLLTMEGKRIQELLLDAEAELKAKQANLVDVRDRVLAALRDHLAHQDELARIEILRRQSWRICQERWSVIFAVEQKNFSRT